ncbi:uncharacterized protein FTOL_13459 [Fusarium torulosum]|uniref:Uncharacterized protein n=1 Tax=Fusarium torulosum TaxID=33205 RepID=A0AAE8MMM8_9HYPO|nr:uncharacterized protein FTOL_13459 [Fusarium torulosum]
MSQRSLWTGVGYHN